jgi:hypothetical protein
MKISRLHCRRSSKKSQAIGGKTVLAKPAACDMLIPSMSISILAFALMAFVSVLFMAVTVVGEGNFKMPALKQTGDSSLGVRSVNWLGAVAFTGAVLICMI